MLSTTQAFLFLTGFATCSQVFRPSLTGMFITVALVAVTAQLLS